MLVSLILTSLLNCFSMLKLSIYISTFKQFNLKSIHHKLKPNGEISFGPSAVCALPRRRLEREREREIERQRERERDRERER